MKTQYYAALSLDGFLATPEHLLDWLLQFGSVEDTSYPTFIRDVGAIAMGSNTYEWILRHQSIVDPKRPHQWPYKQPAWVFTTRSLSIVHGADIRFVRGDVQPIYDQMALEDSFPKVVHVPVVHSGPRSSPRHRTAAMA